MGDLANKQISQTYDGLIQTGTDNPIDGTLRPLQDGSGNNLPVEVSTTGVNFTGTVAGIDTGVQSVVAGTNVTVDATDPANPIVSAAGGGGGGGAEPGLASTTRGINMGLGTVNEQWRLTYVPITYGTATSTITNNTLKIVAMQLTEGQTIRDFSIYVTTSGGEGPVQAVLYKAAIDGNGQLTGGAIEADFGDILANTTGQKIITGINHTLGATEEDVYFLGIHNKSGLNVGVQAPSSTQVAGPYYHGSLYATTMYRGNTFQFTTATTPSTINGINFSKSTDFPIYGIR